MIKFIIRFLIILILTTIIIGLYYPKLQELGLSEIPGDFYLEKDYVKFYFPITTSTLVTCLINLIIWFYNEY